MNMENTYAGCISLMRKVFNKIEGRNFYTEDSLQAKTFCNAIKWCKKPFIDGKDAIKVHQFLQQMIV
jgi:hypothetical protein